MEDQSQNVMDDGSQGGEGGSNRATHGPLNGSHTTNEADHYYTRKDDRDYDGNASSRNDGRNEINGRENGQSGVGTATFGNDDTSNDGLASSGESNLKDLACHVNGPGSTQTDTYDNHAECTSDNQSDAIASKGQDSSDNHDQVDNANGSHLDNDSTGDDQADEANNNHAEANEDQPDIRTGKDKADEVNHSQAETNEDQGDNNQPGFGTGEDQTCNHNRAEANEDQFDNNQSDIKTGRSQANEVDPSQTESNEDHAGSANGQSVVNANESQANCDINGINNAHYGRDSPDVHPTVSTIRTDDSGAETTDDKDVTQYISQDHEQSEVNEKNSRTGGEMAGGGTETGPSGPSNECNEENDQNGENDKASRQGIAGGTMSVGAAGWNNSTGDGDGAEVDVNDDIGPQDAEKDRTRQAEGHAEDLAGEDGENADNGSKGKDGQDEGGENRNDNYQDGEGNPASGTGGKNAIDAGNGDQSTEPNVRKNIDKPDQGSGSSKVDDFAGGENTSRDHVTAAPIPPLDETSDDSDKRKSSDQQGGDQIDAKAKGSADGFENGSGIEGQDFGNHVQNEEDTRAGDTENGEGDRGEGHTNGTVDNNPGHGHNGPKPGPEGLAVNHNDIAKYNEEMGDSNGFQPNGIDDGGQQGALTVWPHLTIEDDDEDGDDEFFDSPDSPLPPEAETDGKWYS
jgi:hypothetical protein